ncbi:MAG: hypothetical protein PF551_05900 [Candidatus Marinimicrobia bacterium]|jgi:hypothetical protein|nr:hypothetical protein [Candidatus Neomarinimicrobiota bacterium]
MPEYEERIKLKFKIFATFCGLFDIPFRHNPTGNPRLALVKKIPNKALHLTAFPLRSKAVGELER